uniref:Immunoglobulin subtype domain-containing protein n=1 Tax=Oreochromis niloticus TaxID=8128 RepID=A0A669B6U3_ORENI
MNKSVWLFNIVDGDSYTYITTVSKVSVKAGKSISIPCLYESQYKNHVKYLCEGYYWMSCSYAVKTNKPDPSGKYLISDNKKLKIFTVTINQLAHKNTDYWCAVEINGEVDDGQYFQLLVSTTLPTTTISRTTFTATTTISTTIHTVATMEQGKNSTVGENKHRSVILYIYLRYLE